MGSMVYPEMGLSMALRSATRRSAPVKSSKDDREDPLFVQSVEKAFRVLKAFSAKRPTLSLSQIVSISGLDKSAAQQFTHTLEQLGYLYKDPYTKHFELTSRTLAAANNYTQSNPLVRRAIPYLLQLATTTEEATNLSVLEDTDVVFVARFISRNAIAPHVTVGGRSPAFCTAPGVAILSQMPETAARAVLTASNLHAYTPRTTWRVPDLLVRIWGAAERGYAVCSEEILINDISIAAPVLDRDGKPVAAVNVAVSKLRYTAAAAETRFAPLVIETAQAISG